MAIRVGINGFGRIGRQVLRAANVGQPLPRCQSGLRARGSRSREYVVSQRDVPSRREGGGEERALVEASLALPRRRKRHGNHEPALLRHIDRPWQPRHALGHPFGDGSPAAVLERMDDGIAGAMAPTDPACRSRRANEGRQQGAPRARADRGDEGGTCPLRMAAPIAPREGERREARPAPPAHLPLLGRVERPVARYAMTGQQQVERADGERSQDRNGAASPRRDVVHRGAGASAAAASGGRPPTAAHIAARSGATPSQRSYASAP